MIYRLAVVLQIVALVALWLVLARKKDTPDDIKEKFLEHYYKGDYDK